MVETEDKLIVEALCADERVNLYNLHKRYRLSPAQLVLAMNRLQHLGIAEYKNLDAIRGPKFEENLLRSRHMIYNRDLYWKRTKSIYPMPT